MSNRADVWNLLRKRSPLWVSRYDLNMVGGLEATRRLREVRADAPTFGYEIQDRPSKDGKTLEYRAMPISEEPDRNEQGEAWKCVACGTSGHRLHSTVDPRFRLGRCSACSDSKAVFRAG